MPNTIAKRLDLTFAWGAVVLTFLLPLFFLPITTDFYLFNKNALLLVGISFFLLLWAAKITLTWQFDWRRTAFDLPLVALVVAYLAATIFASVNKSEALFLPEASGTILLLVIYFFVLTHNLAAAYRRWPLYALLSAGSLLALLAIYQFVGLGRIFPYPWMKAKAWTPMGNPLFLLTFLVTLLPLTFITFTQALTKTAANFKTTLALGLSTTLLVLAIFITFYQILPGKTAEITLLPYKTAWSIAIESFKQKPLIGVGPENFQTAFNRFRPVDFNAYPFWNSRFGASSSYLLQLLTVTGLLGFAAFTWLALKIVAEAKHLAQPTYLSLLLSLVLLLVLPGNLVSLFTLIVLLATWVLQTTQTSVFNFPKKINLPGFVFGLIVLAATGPFLAFVITSWYSYSKVYSAELSFKKSLDAYTENNGNDVYTFQTQAVAANPYNITYHLAFSQTNFTLANLLASKTDLTEQDRTNISQLIEQSIQEGKKAAALNPLDASAWENLAQLYRNLINFAEGADQWALAAYQQTLTTDPVNPRLRVNYGGLFYAFGNYDQAIRHFQDAINLKGDYANAYYNLAASYREQQKYSEAHQALQLALNYVPKDSTDYQKAQTELADLAKKLPSPTPTPSPAPTGKAEDKLTQPSPLPTPPLEEPITLPPDAGLELSPTPTPEAVATPTPTPTPPVTP